jgi:hypothetical protein
MLLACSDEAKEAFDSSFRASFKESFIESCSANKPGSQAMLDMCTCIANKAAEQLSKSEMSNPLVIQEKIIPQCQ